ncbi:MAG: hypothetical protein JOY99_15350 [Sphingomonadaceae bacterium]|nr:hypothetical protein [Sphingomonadaceae bacterium]
MGSAYSYSDIADLSLAAPIVAHVIVTDAILLRGADAAGVTPGHARLYVRATITALLKGAEGMPPDVSFLADLPLDSANHVPKLKKADVLLFASAPADQPAGTLRLVAPDAALAWTPELEARAKAILVAAATPDAPPRITGVASAFHVPGTLPGESETQIFLTTANGHPVSLAVLRRPQEQPRWAVALAEMVDEAAAPPQPQTLLWYRLACELPRQLPDASLANLEPADAAAARDDYQVVLAGLGECGRTRTQN